MNSYFDTSIWLDLFEDRDEPNMPKGKWATELVGKIIRENEKIAYSDLNISELEDAGYSLYEIERLFQPFDFILIYIESTKQEVGKSRDLSLKRGIPKGDALHALIARDNNLILITLDNHFQRLLDIIKPAKPQDII